MKVGDKVVAHWAEKEPGREGQWVLKETIGVIDRDFMLAYCSEDSMIQNLYSVQFKDGTKGRFWTKQLDELIEGV